MYLSVLNENDGVRVKYLMVLVVIVFSGCFSNASNVKSEDAQPIKEKVVSAFSQKDMSKMKQSRKELVAVLCSAEEINKATQTWEKKGLKLVKQSSPTIVSLSWSDSRSSDKMIAALRANKTLFCAVEVNQTYTKKKNF